MSLGGTDQPLDGFDPIYFQDKPWPQRVDDWIGAANAPQKSQSGTMWRDHGSYEFSEGNRHVVQRAIADEDSGLRVVVNIGAHAFLNLLPNGRYLNLYERPVIGGQRKGPSPQRVEVDTALGLLPSDHVYFGAVALGGAGVRYYGEYCMVLKLNQIDPDPQLFDRDSYDILIEPISSLADRDSLVKRLSGKWKEDVQAMVVMKVLPELVHQRRLVTAGTVADVVLKDQEFIEVHLRPTQDNLALGESRSFGPSDVEEVRESPDEVSVAALLYEREAQGHRLTEVEHEWLLQRESIAHLLAKAGLSPRVVSQHGRGYQWK